MVAKQQGEVTPSHALRAGKSQLLKNSSSDSAWVGGQE